MAYLNAAGFNAILTGTGTSFEAVPVSKLTPALAAAVGEVEMFCQGGGLPIPLPSSPWLDNTVFWLTVSALAVPLFDTASDQIAAVRRQLADIRAGKMRPPGVAENPTRNAPAAPVVVVRRRVDDPDSIGCLWRSGGRWGG